MHVCYAYHACICVMHIMHASVLCISCMHVCYAYHASMCVMHIVLTYFWSKKEQFFLTIFGQKFLLVLKTENNILHFQSM